MRREPEAQKAMQRSRPDAQVSHFRLMDDAVPAMVWSARPDMSCDYLSREWLQFTGWAPEQALGDGWSRGVHPEDLARWLDTCVRAFDAREPFQIEYRLRRSDGEYRWVQDRGVPRFAPDGVFVGYVGVCVDVHERKRCEHELGRALERERRLRIATEEAGRIKDGFLATVLYDMRAPVQAIATWARHLRQRVVPDSEAADALESIERNAHAQDRIIGDLLDLSRVAAGGMPATRPAANEALLSNVRVLVAEADAAARESIARVLAIAGAQVHAAASGDEALDALDAFRPDVVVSEVGMRGDDGAELIRSLRARPAERGGCLPAAGLTAPVERAGGIRAVAAGYDAQLAKPVEPVALLATVARLAHPAI